MNLDFDMSLAKGYNSNSQITRVLTEDWFARNMYCPICGKETIQKVKANAPVKDYICENCKSQYELKSKRVNTDSFQSIVADGEYTTMINRITSLDNPSFFFMHYDKYRVNNLIIVPKCFFTPTIIKERKALPPTARRAGWQGCSILMRKIPSIAKIPIILNGVVRPVTEVVTHYNQVFSLQTKSIESRGWLIDTLNLVERLDNTFTLHQMYAFVKELQLKHPKNNNIEAKIRQQLQFLRDKGIIEFKGNGKYRRI